MAWQSSAGMVGNGGGSGAGGDGSNNAVQPQGTEYTLQGTIDKSLQSVFYISRAWV